MYLFSNNMPNDSVKNRCKIVVYLLLTLVFKNKILNSFIFDSIRQL